MNLTNREIVGIYLLLEKNEEKVDKDMQKLKDRIERFLYEHISIEEMENLEEKYRRKIDVLS
jgi:hypothetical protein